VSPERRALAAAKLRAFGRYAGALYAHDRLPTLYRY
jgi:hypothetical protein